MIDFNRGPAMRPCGACGELVSASGCKHWKPGTVAAKKVGRVPGRARVTQSPPMATPAPVVTPDPDEVFHSMCTIDSNDGCLGEQPPKARTDAEVQATPCTCGPERARNKPHRPGCPKLVSEIALSRSQPV